MAITVYLLSPRGYCTSIKRAVDMANQVLKLYKTVYVLEDVIHNKPFMDTMFQQGMIKVDSLNDIPEDSAVMFSAHGIAPSVITEAERKGLTVIDATCAEVRELQSKVCEKSDLGYSIIIIGNRTHQEVISLLNCSDNIFIVNSETDVELLPDLSKTKLVYFTQTSMYPGDVENIVNCIKQKFPHIESELQNNICQSTIERQQVITAIANKIDLLLVVGSSYSANVISLLRTGTASGIKKVIRIDTKDELDEEMFNEIQTVAVTSSSSTPENLVTDVINYLTSNLDTVVKNFTINDLNDSQEVNNLKINNLKVNNTNISNTCINDTCIDNTCIDNTVINSAQSSETNMSCQKSSELNKSNTDQSGTDMSGVNQSETDESKLN